MKKNNIKRMFFPAVLICLGIMVILFTMAVPRHVGDWEINEVRISDSAAAGKGSSLVWTGAEYGLIWTDDRGGDPELYFVKLDRGGNRIGDDMRITNERGSSERPSLVWTGTGYAVAWKQSSRVQFTRIDSGGNSRGDNLLIAFIGNYPSLAWTGEEYGLAYNLVIPRDINIILNRINPDVEIVERIGITDSPERSEQPSLAWNSNDGEYGIAWSENHEIYFAEIDESGLRDSIRITNGTGDSRRPSLVWNAENREYGVVWHDSGGTYFGRITTEGERTVNYVRISNGSNPSLVWTGREYGVVDGNLVFSSVRIDGRGDVVIGDRLHITELLSDNSGLPSLVWTGAEYGVSWTDGTDLCFATLRGIAEGPEAPVLRGMYPSIHENRVVYEHGADIYMYDFREGGEPLQITDDEFIQQYPKIYGDIIVWQHNNNLTEEAEESLGFNWFGFLNNCYARGPDDGYVPDWDIYMYNVGTGEGPTLVAGGPGQQKGPEVYGDYIIWNENSENIGVYQISTGATRHVIEDLGVGYELAGNVIAYTKEHDIWTYNLLTDADERIIGGDIIQGVRGFNGEWVVYSEVIADETRTEPETGPYLYHRDNLKAYNLVTGGTIEIRRDKWIWEGVKISGNKLLYRVIAPEEDKGVWLYNLSNESDRRSESMYQFDIWGHRIVNSEAVWTGPPDYAPYVSHHNILVELLEHNTPAGSGIRVDLGDGISVRFSNVALYGETILEKSTAGGHGGPTEGLFRLARGEETIVYNISTSSDYEGPVDIIISYGEMDPDGLILYHWEPPDWVPLEGEIDRDAGTLTYTTDSLSPFVPGYELRPEVIYPKELGNLGKKVIVSAKDFARPYYVKVYVDSKYRGYSRKCGKGKIFRCGLNTIGLKGPYNSITARVFDLNTRKWYVSKPVYVVNKKFKKESKK